MALFSADLTGIDQAAEERQIISCPFFLGVQTNFSRSILVVYLGVFTIRDFHI